MRYPLYTLTVITGAYPMPPACGAPQEMSTHEVPFIHPNCHHRCIPHAPCMWRTPGDAHS